uniref:SLPTX5 n=1 Tax=Scolopendra viridis TaxID=118503 RepID=A0A4D5RAY4_SCOVI
MMAINIFKASFSIFLFYACIVSTDALKCIECGMPNGEICKATLPNPVDCVKPNDKYCIKVLTRADDHEHILRGCVGSESPNKCVKQGIFEVCTHTCNSNGCNAVTAIRPNGSLLFATASFAIVLIMLRFIIHF